jgi:hypothetical protein
MEKLEKEEQARILRLRTNIFKVFYFLIIKIIILNQRY